MDTSRSQPTHFINVDLDLQSDTSLDAFIEHWGDRVFALRHEGTAATGWTAGFELGETDHSAEDAIVAFADLVDALPEALRTRWDALQQRNIDVGIQAGHHPHSWSFSLEPRTLERLRGIGARLVCTVYPASEGTSTSLPRQA